MSIKPSENPSLVRDLIVSVFIYALPVLLMLGWFAYKGERPWLKQTNNIENVSKNQ